MNTTIWDCPTRVVFGPQALATTLRQERTPCLVIDSRMTGTESGVAIAEAARHVRGTRVVEFTPTDDGLGDVRLLGAELADVDTVVAAGGGSLLDAVKLAVLGRSAPVEFSEYLQILGRRAGLIRLTAPAPVLTSAPRRILVPTTIGTSSEVSPAACVRIDGGRHLVLGPALRPEVAVLDPALTASLAENLLIEGIFEALMRVGGPYVGDSVRDAVTDAIAAATATSLVMLGNRCAAGDVGDALRLDAARLSAYTQVGWSLLGRSSYGSKVWYLANELATVAGVRKVTATACLLPTLWQRIMADDARFGDRRRLATFCLRTGIGHDPVDGILDLLDRWRIERDITLTVRQIHEVADNSAARWGGRLPMLAGLSRADIMAILGESVDTLDAESEPAGCKAVDSEAGSRPGAKERVGV